MVECCGERMLFLPTSCSLQGRVPLLASKSLNPWALPSLQAPIPTYPTALKACRHAIQSLEIHLLCINASMELTAWHKADSGNRDHYFSYIPMLQKRKQAGKVVGTTN